MDGSIRRGHRARWRSCGLKKSGRRSFRLLACSETQTLHAYRDDVRQRITVTVNGPTAFASIVLFIEGQQRGNAWAYSVLYDFGDVVPDVTEEDVHLIAGHVGDLDLHHARRPIAVVGTNPQLEPLIARYRTFMQRMGLRVALFRSRAAAEQWLDAQNAVKNEVAPVNRHYRRRRARERLMIVH